MVPLREDIPLPAQLTAHRIIATKYPTGYADACRWVPEDYVAHSIAERLRTRRNARGVPVSDENLRIRIAEIRTPPHPPTTHHPPLAGWVNSCRKRVLKNSPVTVPDLVEGRACRSTRRCPSTRGLARGVFQRSPAIHLTRAARCAMVAGPRMKRGKGATRVSFYLDLLISYPIASGLEPPTPGHPLVGATRIAVTQNYAIYGQLKSFAMYRNDDRLDIPESPHIHPQPLPPGVSITINGDRGVHKDAYGDPLTWCTAEQLCALRIPKEDENPWSRATMAFLHALPPSTPIVLYWH